MAAKKSTKKTPATKSAKKAPATATKKPVSKKTTSKKSTVKKPAAKKAATRKTPTAKAAAKKTSAKKATRGPAKQAKETPVEVEPAAPKEAKGGLSSLGVNIGHVFTLRPRVNTSYRQADFMAAKQLLRNETYANIQEATRAVVEKALELTHQGSPLQRSGPKRH